MKKAASNLSQQFKVYVPSKRLPIFDQKRMLAKELQDFLHIYKRDTEQLKLDYNYDIEAQKQKDKKGSFNEILLINFLNKCTETQLEEIMSSYMKNSKDSSAFLGNKKSVSETPTTTTMTNEERKISSASVSKKPLVGLSTTTESVQSSNNNGANSIRKNHFKNVTSISVNKSRANQRKNEDYEITDNYENNIDNSNDSFSSSSNSSLNLSSEVAKNPNKNNQPQQLATTQKFATKMLIDEGKLQKGIDRIKSATNEKRRVVNNYNNNLNTITRDKIRSTIQNDTDKLIFSKTEKSIAQSAAAMTMNLQSQLENRQQSLVYTQQLRKRKYSFLFFIYF